LTFPTELFSSDEEGWMKKLEKYEKALQIIKEINPQMELEIHDRFHSDAERLVIVSIANK
jgi:predicted HTH transcriptional regulator